MYFKCLYAIGFILFPCDKMKSRFVKLRFLALMSLHACIEKYSTFSIYSSKMKDEVKKKHRIGKLDKGAVRSK